MKLGSKHITGGDRSWRGFFWLAVSGVVSIANSVIIWIAMARLRDVEEVGRFSVAMGLYALLFSIVSLGLMPYLIKEISVRLKAGDSLAGFVGSSSMLLLSSGFVIALLMSIAGLVISDSVEVRLSMVSLSLALLPSGLIALGEASAIARERSVTVAAITTIENVLRTVIPLAMIWSGASLFSICLSFALVRYVALLLYIVNERKLMARITVRIAEVKRLASLATTFAATIVFASVNWQAALVVLGYFGTEADTAKFGVASRFLIPAATLIASYASALGPELGLHAKEGSDMVFAYLMKKAQIPLLVAVVAAVGSFFLSGDVLAMMFGPQYRDASAALILLTLSVIPFCVVMITAWGLVALGRQRIDLAANIAGSVVCIAVAMLAIPQYGATGAAAAQLAAFTVMAVIEVGYCVRMGRTRRFLLPSTVSPEI